MNSRKSKQATKIDDASPIAVAPASVSNDRMRKPPPPRAGGGKVFRAGAGFALIAAITVYWIGGLSQGPRVEPPTHRGQTTRALTLSGIREFDRLRFLDVTWYLDIAQNGYQLEPDGKQSNVVFFPLWPFLMRGTSEIFSVPPAKSGAILNLLFVMLAAGTTALVAHRFVGGRDDAADQSPPPGDLGVPAVLALALLLHPMGIFLHALYPESLFLALLGSMLLARERGRLGLVAAAAFLLALTRPQGLFVPIAFIMRDVLTMAERRRVRVPRDTIAAVGGSFLGLFSLASFMNKVTGDPWIFFTGQAAWYGQKPSVWNIPLALAPTIAHDTLLPKLILYFGLGGAYLLWRRGETLVACLAAVFLLIPLRVGDFGDYQRYSLLAIYAAYPWLERLYKRPWRLAAYFCVSALMAGFFLSHFLAHHWIG